MRALGRLLALALLPPLLFVAPGRRARAGGRGVRSVARHVQRNPYDVLGLSSGCSYDDIRAAFRKLARRGYPYHLLTSDTGDEDRFRSIREALEELGTPAGRARWSGRGGAHAHAAHASRASYRSYTSDFQGYGYGSSGYETRGDPYGQRAQRDDRKRRQETERERREQNEREWRRENRRKKEDAKKYAKKKAQGVEAQDAIMEMELKKAGRRAGGWNWIKEVSLFFGNFQQKDVNLSNNEWGELLLENLVKIEGSRELRFQPDDIVEFQGLVKCKEDNGKVGTILGYDSKKKRYEVAVKWQTDPKKIKAESPGRTGHGLTMTMTMADLESEEGGAAEGSRAVSAATETFPTATADELAKTEKSPGKETKKRTTSKGRRSRSRKSRRRSRSQSRRRKSRSPSNKKRARHEAAPAQSGREGVAPAFVPSAPGKGGGKGGNKGRNFQISKALARILRHTAQSLGLQIRADGFCQLQDDILALSEFTTMGATAEDVQVAVQSNDKKRFETKVEADKVLIRAVQGHSMKAGAGAGFSMWTSSMMTVDDDSLLKRLNADDPNLPKVCVHGTYRRNVDSIQRNGLLVGGGVSQRNHVHFAPYEPHDGRVISGMRYNCEEGVPFFQSANEVILSPGINGTVPAKYISKAVKEAEERQARRKKMWWKGVKDAAYREKEMTTAWNVVHRFQDNQKQLGRRQAEKWKAKLEATRHASAHQRKEDGEIWVQKFTEVKQEAADGREELGRRFAEKWREFRAESSPGQFDEQRQVVSPEKINEESRWREIEELLRQQDERISERWSELYKDMMKSVQRQSMNNEPKHWKDRFRTAMIQLGRGGEHVQQRWMRLFQDTMKDMGEQEMNKVSQWVSDFKSKPPWSDKELAKRAKLVEVSRKLRPLDLHSQQRILKTIDQCHKAEIQRLKWKAANFRGSTRPEGDGDPFFLGAPLDLQNWWVKKFRQEQDRLWKNQQDSEMWDRCCYGSFPTHLGAAGDVDSWDVTDQQQMPGGERGSALEGGLPCCAAERTELKTLCDDFSAACEWIENGPGSALRFKFFWNNVIWRMDEIDELAPERGIWIPVAVSCDLLLREPDSSFEDPLWAQYALKAGGELKELGERFGLFPPEGWPGDSADEMVED
eukprot:s215_g14.t1